MLKIYPAIFYKENDSLWVESPDLEGYQSYGSTLEETMEHAQEALGLYIASKLDSNDTINKPSDIKAIESNDGFVSYVPSDISKYRNKTLTIPELLNEEAEKINLHLNITN